MRTTFCMIGLMALSALARGQNKMGFDLMVNMLISTEVDTIGTRDLKEMIQNGNTILLDAREKPEYDVSHLLGAHWARWATSHSNGKVERITQRYLRRKIAHTII